MRRREVLELLGSAAAWPLAARAQHPGHMRRIGVLMSMDESDPEGQAHLAGFTQALSELGWTRGRNLQMEVRWGAPTSIGSARSRKSWLPSSLI